MALTGTTMVFNGARDGFAYAPARKGAAKAALAQGRGVRSDPAGAPRGGRRRATGLLFIAEQSRVSD
ncbi:hypothetical protein [Nitratireductor sp. XY-223]|uniref:hypothetical protein n=1 Tax=Nitratireductor sp. XY-223 TaxID=2561926 RepID=UPI0010AB1CB3|nr:hypothetical protein [Nitratireductor sp. XY-223]